MIKYRIPTLKDKGRLLELLRDHFLEASMVERGYTWGETSCEKALERAILSEAYFFLVCEEDGIIVAMTCFIRHPSLFNENEIQLSEILWYGTTNKNMVLVFNEAMNTVDWSVIRAVRVGSPSPAVHKFLRKKGFILTESSFMKHNSKGGDTHV